MNAQEIIALVHKRDKLVAERAEIVAHLDLEIEEIDMKLNGLTPSRNGRANGHDDEAEDDGDEADERSPRPGSNTEKVVNMIRKSPTLDYRDVCIALYGADSPPLRKRLRSLLSSLHTNKWIRNVGPNTWEVLR